MRVNVTRANWLGGLAALLLASACAVPGSGDDVDLGPLFYSHNLTLEEGREGGMLDPSSTPNSQTSSSGASETQASDI